MLGDITRVEAGVLRGARVLDDGLRGAELLEGLDAGTLREKTGTPLDIAPDCAALAAPDL